MTGIEPQSVTIARYFQHKLRMMTNTWGSENQFHVRREQFRKVSEDTQSGSFVECKTFWGLPIILIPNEVVSSIVYAFGLFEPGLTSFFVDYLYSGAVVIDIGAHIGFFSMLSAELVGKQGRVVAFEPTPSTVEILKKNVNRYSQVTVVTKLVWHENGKVDFHIFNSDYSAFNTAVSDRLNKEQKARAESSLITVDAVTLDSFSAQWNIRPDLVKIDAESSEMQVLQGMTRLLDKVRPVVTIEVGDVVQQGVENVPLSKELLNFVRKYDYKALEYVAGRYQGHDIKEGNYVYDNIIMVPREKLPNRKPLGTVAVNEGRFY